MNSSCNDISFLLKSLRNENTEISSREMYNDLDNCNLMFFPFLP